MTAPFTHEAEPRLTRGVPPRLAKDLATFTSRLNHDGLRAALLFLNSRTPHRYTGVFRFDADMLRSVALVDKWDSEVIRGDDVPLAKAYCAHLHQTGGSLDILHGPSDPRFPWMKASSVLSYCGAVIDDEQGGHWGALCHFDTLRCESKDSDLPILIAAAALIHQAASAA